MWLFPYEKFSIITNLTPDEVMKRLENTEPTPARKYFKRFYPSYNINKYFNGVTIGNVSKFHRIITGRNSFLPMIKCVVNKSETGSNITIRMRIHPVVLIFCLWILLVFGLFSKATLKHIVLNYEPTSYIPFLLAYSMSLFMFKYEAPKDRDLLLEIFEGEIQQST